MSEFRIPTTTEMRSWSDDELLDFNTDLAAASVEAEAEIAGFRATGRELYPSTVARAKRLQDWGGVVRAMMVERGIVALAPARMLTRSSFADLQSQQREATARFEALWRAVERYVEAVEGDASDERIDQDYERVTVAHELLRPYMTGAGA